MKNKTLGIGMLVTFGFLTIVAMIESSISIETASSLYAIGGLGLFFFGIWVAIKLIKS